MASDWSEEPDCIQRGSGWTDFGNLSKERPIRKLHRRKRKQSKLKASDSESTGR